MKLLRKLGGDLHGAGELMGGLAISEHEHVMYTGHAIRCLHSGLAQDGVTTFDILPGRLLLCQ